MLFSDNFSCSRTNVPEYYAARMNSPLIRIFEVSSADTPETVEALKTTKVAEMKTRIEEVAGAKDIRFSVRRLNEPINNLVTNITWEIRADF